MKIRMWLMFLVTALLVVLPVSPVSAQDIEDPEYDPIEELDLMIEDELEPITKTLFQYDWLAKFQELLIHSGLVAELGEDGPFTVFAPDDEAFDQLPSEETERLKSDRKHCRAILSRHIVKGQQVIFGDDSEIIKVTVMSGDIVYIDVSSSKVMVGKAWVVDEQTFCSNGVIHVIDAVLLPSRGQQED